TARQVYTERGHPGIEATVTTANGAEGVAMCTAGISIGEHEIPFKYDGGTKWYGKGVTQAVAVVNEVIAPALKGMDASGQQEIDDALLNLGGPNAKERLGGNATAAVSAAALKAGAASLVIPLYQHIGGSSACTLPVAGVHSVWGALRYGGGQRSGTKPSYSLMCYGFDTFSDASYAAWELGNEWDKVMLKKFDLLPRADYGIMVPRGKVNHDREFWAMMAELINKLGYEGKVGIQVDCAATTYWDKEKGKFVGLFSAEDKTREDLIELYKHMVKNYPFVIIEDPLEENDYEGHAIVTKELGIQIVGDDLFTTNPKRVQQGIDVGACNTVLLKVNQIGTISEAFDMVQLAYRNGYGVMPCSSRGEGSDIADYTVGLNCGNVRESALGATGNRFLKIEAELGRRAKFLGRNGLKLARA
ncbi:MAG: phosphopyruvate hydratase, partial [Bacteroidetes bacterium]|nr:phosphopyruvate hydratase [Bacteroidota bacterium]